jgi:hypothetical protein
MLGRRDVAVTGELFAMVPAAGPPAMERVVALHSTPARLYQLRSKITISPAAGKCCM